MLHKFTADCHSHTTFSPDGANSAEEMCQRAAEIGLDYYTITDHCEANEYEGPTGEERVCFVGKPVFNFKEKSAAGLERMRELQGIYNGENGKTRLLKGVELGQSMQNIAAAEEVVARDYDFVLASVHNVGGFNDFYWIDYESVDKSYIKNLISKYFAELLEIVKWGKFDALSHLTYPVRYIRTPDGVPYDLSAHNEEIEAVLEAVVKSQKAIELNVSGLYNVSEAGKKTSQPTQDILDLYRKMGAKYITIGSDSHRTADVGGGIDEGLDMIKKAGFDSFTVYENHEPHLLAIE